MNKQHIAQVRECTEHCISEDEFADELLGNSYLTGQFVKAMDIAHEAWERYYAKQGEQGKARKAA